MRRAHGLKHGASRYALSGRCRACLTLFAARHNLVDHLQHRKPACLRQLTAWYEPMDTEETAELDALDNVVKAAYRRSGRPSFHADIPARRCAGPLLAKRARADSLDLSIPLPAEVQVEPWQRDEDTRDTPIPNAGPQWEPAGIGAA